ncbi:MAG: HEAT repeat domain-containing protein [Nitrospinae bacterium]|nr:HEAT repeat domain-containing protein [Nitrospinota bacterium]
MRRHKREWCRPVILLALFLGCLAIPPAVMAASVDDLILSLEQGGQDQKLNSIRRLGSLRDARALRPLLNSLQDRSDDLVRRESARALGLIGDKRAVPVLVTRLKEERVAVVRANIAEALGNLKDPRSVEALVKATEDSDLLWIRLYAAWALGEIRDGRAIAPLLNMFGTAEHVFIHNEAKIALIKSAEVWKKVEKGDTTLVYGAIKARKRIKTLKRFLIEMLTDPNDGIRLIAVKALGRHADAEGVEYLRRVAVRDTSRNVRKAAKIGLAKLGYKLD